MGVDGRPGRTLHIPETPPEIRVTIADPGMDLELLRDDLVATLDPAAGVMVAFGWRPADVGPGRLLVVAHHVVVDGVSLRILAEDIAAAHRLIVDGKPATLPPAETSWRTWAQRLTDATVDGAFDDDLEHWQGVCSTSETPWGDRPLDPARDTVASEARVTVELPAAVTEAVLTDVPDRIHGHVNDAMVAALYLALREWRSDRGHDADGAVLLEMEGHGREAHRVGDLDLSATVGWFTTLYPVALRGDDFDWRAAVSDGTELGAAVRSVKDQLRVGAVARAQLWSVAVSARRDETLAVAPQVLFNYLGRFDTGQRPWAFAGDHVAVMEDRDPAMPLPRLLEVNAEAVTVDGATVLRATFSWPSGAVAGVRRHPPCPALERAAHRDRDHR